VFGGQAPLPTIPQEVTHAPAIPIATPQAQFDRGFILKSPYTPQEPLEYADVKKRIVRESRNSAVADEFVAAAVSADTELESLRSLESLQLQTKGDKALQSAQLELARTSYQAAITADPTRNGVWHRMAMVQLYQHDFDAAASSLKRILTSEYSSPTEFIDLATLLGPHRDSAQWAADQSVWQWLMQRPASVDRLHLVAAWQGFTGNHQRAMELVELATLVGADEVQTDMVRAVLSGSVPASETASGERSQPVAPAAHDESLKVPDTDETPPLNIPPS